MKRNLLTAVFCLILLSGCTSVSIDPIDSSEGKISEICIKRNPKVIVPEFINVLQEGFSRHGISTKIYDDVPSNCNYYLTYIARQGWDFVMVLTGVHLAVFKKGEMIGSADRDAPLNGGFNLSKWDSTRTIVNPMIDELLGRIAPLQTAN